MKRPAATLLIVGSAIAMLVAGIAAVLVVALVVSNLRAPGAPTAGAPTAGAPPAAEPPGAGAGSGSATPPPGERLADYTFGHTAAVVAPNGPGAPTELTERLPFRLGADVTSLRLHVRNWDYIGDRPIPGAIDISGIALGRAASAEIPGESSAFAEAPLLVSPGSTLTDGEEYVSDWLDASSIGFENGVPFILSLGISAPAGVELGAAGSVAWRAGSAEPALVTRESSVGDYSMDASFLDIWLEYTLTSDEKLVVVAGHSLNSGANSAAAEHPHAGENSAWHQLWANENDGLAASLSAPGSWTTNFPPDSPKWELYDGLQPDAFVLWSASNDLAGGQSIDVLRSAWLAALGRAQERWPDARLFAMTEPGRGLTGPLEANRVLWNASLRADTSGLFTVIDADALLSDPDRPSLLDPAIDGDGIHPTPAGNQRIADAFERALSGR
ncbi:hypothetical protein C5B96_02965 [Subtercola sp. Z020]|uniref:SGNH/GDSL hydrolase family protein n=1 Tax=Subtercola sp. Z020 TaxID=2080582 RepID=UPI000CE91F77|nr:GDSL-type esterase/lipase family protein [Subtercola sp. Z020]PPF88255.1 hypothetical protein C5B96_02965 [Subtercola sp. Z020]